MITVERFNLLRNICHYAYTNNIDTLKHISNADHIRHIRDDKTDSDAFILWIKDEVIVHFRGTEKNWKDIIFNFITCRKKVEKGCYCHKGYLIKTLTILPFIFKELVKIDDKSKIWICGDSQGGGLARVFYFLLGLTMRFKDVNLFTIGTPAMSNKKFNKEIENDNCYHYLNDTDPIRLVPTFLIGFKHPVNTKMFKTGKKWFSVGSHFPLSYVYEE